jgi:signal transduction histidine kinase
LSICFVKQTVSLRVAIPPSNALVPPQTNSLLYINTLNVNLRLSYYLSLPSIWSGAVQTRSRTFLTFALFCILPLLLFSGINFLVNVRSDETVVRNELEHELAATTQSFETLLRERKQEIRNLAASRGLQTCMRATNHPVVSLVVNRPAGDSNGNPASPPADNELQEAKNAIASLLRGLNSYRAIAAFAPGGQVIFVAEEAPTKTGDIIFRTHDLLAEQIQPEKVIWTAPADEVLCSIISTANAGKTLRCTTLIAGSGPANPRGALVADLRLDSVISSAARPLESSIAENKNTSRRSTVVLVIDDQDEIVYHTNAALKHQHAQSAMPYLGGIGAEMVAGQSGANSFKAADGDQWLATYAPLMGNKLSLAVARNYSLASRDTRRYGWIGIALALLVGSSAAVVLTQYYRRRTKSIDRVAAGVDEIVKGKLDHRIELLSSDALRPLADNVGLVTKQLREQIAREAESRQFQSFVRLSAVLTHDLKNAIEALSLIVNNMEKHYEKEEFRVDAMQSLTAATDKLRALVTRLSNPVNTLSGEHKRPRPVDLVPILKRVIAMTAEPARTRHEIAINLPEALVALVDGDRMDKVMENLIINGLEAMAARRGKLTVAAGKTADGKPYFSVSDTGEGMSERFIAERLFHPFATTKPKGVGLGLYTCREVVSANGGTIQVESEQGAGTTFRVVLPSPQS